MLRFRPRCSRESSFKFDDNAPNRSCSNSFINSSCFNQHIPLIKNLWRRRKENLATFSKKLNTPEEHRKMPPGRSNRRLNYLSRKANSPHGAPLLEWSKQKRSRTLKDVQVNRRSSAWSAPKESKQQMQFGAANNATNSCISHASRSGFSISIKTTKSA